MGEREKKAFALAPLPVLVPLLFATGVNAAVRDMGDATVADIILAMLALVLFSYGATFLIGIPIHLVLRRFHKTALIYYLSLTVLPFFLLAGVMAAWLRLAAAPAPPVNPFGLYMQGGVVIGWTLAFAAMASLSATTFWYAGVRLPNPERPKLGRKPPISFRGPHSRPRCPILVVCRPAALGAVGPIAAVLDQASASGAPSNSGHQ